MSEEIAYLENGNKVKVHEKTSSGYIVSNIYIDGEEIESDRLYFTEEIYDTSPMPSYHKLKDQLYKEVESLSEKKKELETTIKNMEERLQELFKYEEIKKIISAIEPLLNKSHPYYLEKCGFSSNIINEKDIIKKFLVLYQFKGEYKWKVGNYIWSVDEYINGNRVQEIVPCESREDAINRFKEYIISEVEEEPSFALNKYIAEKIEKFNIELPENTKEMIRQERINDIKSQIDIWNKKIDENNIELQKLMEQ